VINLLSVLGCGTTSQHAEARDTYHHEAAELARHANTILKITIHQQPLTIMNICSLHISAGKSDVNKIMNKRSLIH